MNFESLLIALCVIWSELRTCVLFCEFSRFPWKYHFLMTLVECTAAREFPIFWPQIRNFLVSNFSSCSLLSLLSTTADSCSLDNPSKYLGKEKFLRYVSYLHSYQHSKPKGMPNARIYSFSHLDSLRILLAFLSPQIRRASNFSYHCA